MDDTTQTGGKLYGQGVYGCVFAGPPLKCKGDIKENKKNAEVKDGVPITKIMAIDEAVEEFAIAKEIQRLPLWKNYFLVAEKICEPEPNQTQLTQCDMLKGKNMKDYRLLTGSFGGQPIVSYKLNFYKTSFEDIFKHILEAGALFALFGIVHWDLHLGNILVDSAGVPRIIDFNMALAVKDDPVPNELRVGFQPNLFQSPPDSNLIVAIRKEIDPYVAIDTIIKGKPVLNTIQAILGINPEDMKKDLKAFYETSKSLQNGDTKEWFHYYWSKIDSWSIGAGTTVLLSKYLLWPAFSSGQYTLYSERMLTVLRGMCQADPRKRLDCVQALAQFDPTNYIVVKYGKKWLEKVAMTS